MKAYISIGFKSRQTIDHIVQTIKNCLIQFEIDPLVFVDTYSFSSEEEWDMMDQAFAEIDSSDIVIVEGSEKAIGVGIEVGYAKARNKPIFYLRNVNSEHSTTLSGTSDYHVFYTDEKDLKEKLLMCLQHWNEKVSSKVG